MAARFFVDENDLALGKALATLHDGVVYPGHHDLPKVVRGFVLTGSRSQSTANSLALLQRCWTQIEALADERLDGPWMYAVTMSPTT